MGPADARRSRPGGAGGHLPALALGGLLGQAGSASPQRLLPLFAREWKDVRGRAPARPPLLSDVGVKCADLCHLSHLPVQRPGPNRSVGCVYGKTENMFV